MNCKSCGDKIPEARLEILPNTEYCVKCADGNAPPVVHDPDKICLKSSATGRNGFAPKD